MGPRVRTVGVDVVRILAIKVIDCGLVVGVVVAVGTVIAMIVVTAVPGSISVEAIVVVNHRATMPVTVPGIPSPSAAAR